MPTGPAVLPVELERLETEKRREHAQLMRIVERNQETEARVAQLQQEITELEDSIGRVVRYIKRVEASLELEIEPLAVSRRNSALDAMKNRAIAELSDAQRELTANQESQVKAQNDQKASTLKNQERDLNRTIKSLQQQILFLRRLTPSEEQP